MKTSLQILLLVAITLCLCYSASAIESTREFPLVKSGEMVLILKTPLPEQSYVQAGGLIQTGISKLDELLQEVGASSLESAFVGRQPNIYVLKFDPSIRVETALATLQRWKGIEATSPCPLVPMLEMQAIPNDLLFPAQWHHELMQSSSAWFIYQGSKSVQVAIIDGGVNYNHSDLKDNIWINPGEDLNGNRIINPEEWNGTDDDGNGYVDDFWGWDWVNESPSMVYPGEDPGPPDNDPMDFGGHGTHCAGDACATTNNALGVAAPGFNSQIMALRAGYLATSGQGYVDLLAAIQAVHYAIDQDAEVISMSFGGSSWALFHTALQEALSAGLVLVAAAGNDHVSQISYPAGYDSVIAVAATGPGDILADFTNYGTWITVSAPGVSILSTTMDGWGNMSGTSMATPVTAGVAALVKGLQPEWNSEQVGQWLAQTADNIDAQNPGYIGLMGGGRINAAHAVDMFVSIDSLWAMNAQSGDRLHFDEEGSLLVRYHKYFGSAQNVTLTLSSTNPRVTFSQAVYTIGDLVQGQTGDNTSNPFRLTVQSDGSTYEILYIDALFNGDGFQFTQNLQVPVGRAQVLIIDADQGQEERTSIYYERSLDSLYYTHETWRRQDRISLGTDLLDYAAIIHFSGTATTNIFPGNDWIDLQNYLNNGGNLIVSGQNVAQDLVVSQPAVLTNILKVEYLQPHSNILTVKGSPGNPLTEGMYFVMAGSGGAGNQTSMDMVSALPGAESFFVYRTTLPDELAGVRVQQGNGDLFYCAFGMEGINDSTSTYNKRIDVLRMMFEQFDINSVGSPINVEIPTAPALYPPHPNPFNSTLTISYTLPKTAPVTITIYDLSGKQVISSYRPADPAGINQWQWHAPLDLSSGVYFIELHTLGHRLIQKTVFMK